MKTFRNKTFRAVVGSITLLATTFVYSGPPRPSAQSIDIVPVHPMYLGTINGGVKTNDSYTDGNFSIVAPVWSTLGADNALSGGSLFLEPYISWGEGGEVVSSLGLGYRYLFGSQSMQALTMHDGHQAGFFEEGVAIGGNIFIDMLDTEANNQLWQLGVGAELQTRYVELRGNYYIPLSNKQLAEETRTRRTFTSSNSSTSTFQAGSGIGDPYATGNTIAQDINLATYATTTTRTTTTTIEQLFRRYEEGMEGWDAEMAVLVPGVDRYFDLRLVGGYYSFDNQPFGPQTGGTGNVEGWKAGVEVRPVPAVILNGTWYEDDRLTGSDWTVGLQLQMPFEAGDLGDGKGFWDRIGDSFKPRRRHLIERMAEPVRRQNAAIKVANSFDEDTRVVSQKSNVQRVTKVVQQTNQRLVLMDDVIFVNNGAATGNGIQAGNVAGTGTAEQPVNTIQAGANIAGTNSNSSGRVWNVYTQGGAASYAENVTANLGSVNFVSSGRLIAGQGGKSFGTGAIPNLTGGFSASNINTLGVTAYNISGGFAGAEGILATNVTNLKLDQVAIQNAGTHGISLNNLSGTAALVDVSVNGSANNGVQVTGGNVISTLLAQNLDITGSGNSGLNFIGATGTYQFDATSSIDDATNAAVRLEGGSADVNFAGDITQANNAALVTALAGHTGDLVFQTGTLSATAGEGLLFNDADGTYNFLGTTTLTNGAKVAILNGSAGDFGFAAGTSITNGAGQGILVDNSTADVTYAGSISQNSGSLFQAINHSTGTVAFTATSNLSATGGDGLLFNNADGTYQFLGTTTLNGGDAGIDLVNGSDGTFAFGAGTSITNPSGHAFFVDGGNSVVAYAGTITDNSGFAVQILNRATGSANFTGTVTSASGGNGIQLLNNGGQFSFTNYLANNTLGNAIDIQNSATATHTFFNITVTSPTGRGVNLLNAGSVMLADGSINGTGGEGIFSQNTSLSATSLTIGDNTSLTTPTFGIVVSNTDGTARTLNLSNNTIRAQIDAIATTDSGVAGELTLFLSGNTYETTLPGGKALDIVGSGADSTTIASLSGGTVIGNGNGGGIHFNRVTFDSDSGTAGIQAISAGDWNIGQGAGSRVFGDGASFVNTTGVVNFGALNIFNTNGTGSLVDTKGLGTAFALNNVSGVIDTAFGTAVNLDPLTVNLTFSSVTSTSSGTSGIILDEVAGTLNLGNVTITNSAGAAYVQNNSTAAVTAGTVNISNAGGAGMVFSSAGGSFTAGETEIDGFQGTGIDFTGSGVNATFGVTTISKAFNDGTDTGIDLSGTTGNSISFAAGSSISNVAVGVELSASGTTATSANALFVFGDGEGDINTLSSINATTTVNAIGLAATGVYDFDDVDFIGTAGFPASAGSAMFVSATAANGVGDGSFLNPYSVHDADAITTGGTFAFLDGSYDFATLNGGLAFTLSSGQSVTGLDNAASVVYGTTQPTNVLGDFGMLGGTATRENNETLAIVNSASANVFEMQGSNSIYNLTVNGSANTSALFSSNEANGIVIYGVTATGLAPGNTALSFSNMTGNVSAQGNNINASGGTLLSINGGTATYNIVKGVLPDPASTPGTLAGRNVNISVITGGTVTLAGASIANLNISDTSGGSTVNVNDATIAAVTGMAVNISNSTGAVNFNAATSITGGTGVAFNVFGGSGNIIHNGTLTQNHAASAVKITDRAGGAVTFGGAITASTGTATAIHLANNSGAINFNGGFSINTTTATAFIAFGGGTLNVAAGPSTTINTTEGGLGLQFSNINLGSATFDSINVVDGLSSGTNGAVNINGVFGGSLSIGDISVERVLVDAISITNVVAGTYAFTGLTSVNSTFMGANAIDVSNTAAGVGVSFANLDITTVNGGAAVLLNNNDGAISFTGGQINRVTGGDAINSTNSNLTVSNVSIGNTFPVNGRGVNIANTGANVSTVTLTNNIIRTGGEAIRTTDSATGTLLLNVSGNTLQTTGAGVKTVHVAGAGLNSTIITGFNGGTIIGNGAGDGVFIDRATFDSDAVTAGIQQVSAGGWIIGQSTGARVSGDGLNFTNPTGDLSFGLLNIFNFSGTGLLVDAKLTTFTLGGGASGTVNTSGGTALNLDPLTANLNFGTVVSNNSGAGNPGVILDGVAGSVTIGSLTVDSSGADGLVVQNSSANVTLGNVFITNTGDDGIHLAGNTGSFQTSVGGSVTVAGAAGDGIDLTGLTANPTVNMLSTVIVAGFGGIGVNFTGANVTAAFGVTTIANGGPGTAIDLSSTTGTRNITFAAGSEISNVSIGVQIGATSGTAANANFIFGDGLSGNGLLSSISATTTVAALGLDPAPSTPGVYNFNDVTFTGAPLFPSAPGGAVFVSATALNGMGDGSLANPYSVADANALTGTLTFGFLDGTYNFASLGANGFTLEANQSATGLDNGNGIGYGVLQPNRVLGNFGMLGGIAARTGNGTLSITNGTASGSVFSLLGGNSLSHLTLTGEAGANDPSSLLSINGSVPGFNNAGGISVEGVTMANVQPAASVISATNSAGAVLIQNNNINIGARLLDINGGTSAFSILKGTGTLTAASLRFRNTTGGSLAISGASLNTPSGTSVALDNNDAAVTLTNLAITRATGATAFSIDTVTGGSTGAITIDGASTLDSTAGAAFSIGLGARNINASALNFSNIGTASGTVINSVGQSGGTISFGNINITGFNSAAGIAVNLQGTSSGTVLFGDLDIATTAGQGLNVGAINFHASGTPTISANARALIFTGTTINGGSMSFTSVASTNSTGHGISMTNVTGATTFNQVAISGSALNGADFNNAGTVNILGGSIHSVTGHGVHMMNTAGLLDTINIGGGGTVGGNGVRVFMGGGGSIAVDVTNLTLSNIAGKGITFTNDGIATQTLSISSTSVSSVGNALEAAITAPAGMRLSVVDSSFASSAGTGILANGTGGTGILTVTGLANNFVTSAATGGMIFNKVTFDADPVAAGIQQVAGGDSGITATGAGLSLTNVTGNLGFGAMAISNTGGTGLFINSGMTYGQTGGSIATVNGAAMNITNASLNTTFASVSSTSSPIHAIRIGTGTSGTVNLGNVTVTGTNTAFHAVEVANSAAIVTAGSLNINGAGRGVSASQNTGSFTVTGATSMQNLADIGILADNSAVTFTGNVTITGSNFGMLFRGTGSKSFGNVDINNAVSTGVVLGATGASNDTGSITIGALSVDLVNGPGTFGIIANAYEGAASFGATTIGTAGTAGSGGTIQSLLLANNGITGGSITFASLSIAETDIGIRSANHNMALTVSGATTLSNTATTGIQILTTTGNHVFNSITITGPTATGFQFGANTGTFLANGTTTLTGITGTGINANAATGDYIFSDLHITYSGAGRGIDLRDSNVRFGANNFTLTGNNTAGSIGIDLSGSLNPNGANSPLVNIGLAAEAGQTAAISGVATGVKLGDAVDGSAGAYLTYGNQTLVNSGSSIAVIAGGTTIDTSNLTSTDPFTQGRYEFRGVIFTGQATFEGTNPNFIFVGTNAAGAANGSNPNNRISTATFLSTYNTAAILANKTVVFVNDNVAGINLGASTLNLGANTVLAGFGNGATVTVAGSVQPVNVIGDTFVPGGGNFTDAAGAATVLSNAGVSTLTLNTGNVLSNFVVGNGGTSILGTNFGTLAIEGMVINNALGGAMTLNNGTLVGTGFNSVTSGGGVNAISLTSVAGALNFGTGSLSGASGATFSVNGGTIALNYSGDMTQANNAALLSVSGGHSVGTLQFLTGALSATNGVGLAFNNADGTYNFSGATTLNGGSARIEITNGSAGTFAFGANTSVTSPADTAFVLSGSTANVTYSGNITQASNNLAVFISNHTTGTVTFQTGTISATNGTGILLLDADGIYNFNGTTTLNGGDAGVDIFAGSSGTVTFGTGASITNPTGVAFDVEGSSATVTYNGTITQNNAQRAVYFFNNTAGTTTLGGLITASTGTADAITLSTNTGATINFIGGLNLTTTTGAGLYATSGGTVTVAATDGTETITTTGGGVGFSMANTTIGATGVTFDSITGTGTSTDALVSLNAVGNTGTFTVTGTTSTNGQAGISIFNSGNATFGTVNILGRTGAVIGIDIGGATGTLQFGNTTVNNTASATGVGIRYNNSTGSATFAQTNVDQNGVFFSGIQVSGGSGSFTSNGGTIEDSAVNEVVVSGGTGTVSIASAITNTAGGSIHVTTRGAGAGDVTFSGNINDTGTGMDVTDVAAGTITFSGTSKVFNTGTNNAVHLTNNTGGTINFTNGGLVITTTTGTGLRAIAGGTISVQGTDNTVTTTTGAGVYINGVTIGDDGVTFDSVSTNGSAEGILLDSVGNNAFTVNGGSIVATSRGVDINGGGGNVSIAATITTSGASARSVEVTNHTGGTVTFSGVFNDTSQGLRLDGNTGGAYNFTTALKTFNTTTNNAVTLTNNTGATINFNSGGLNIDTTTGTGFTATGGGTINVTTTAADESISSVGGRAMLLNGVTAGISFDSVSSSNSATTGVDLQSIAGTVNIGGGTITGAAGIKFNVTGGNATVTYSGTMNGTAGRLIAVSDTTGGSVTFNTGTLAGLVDSGTGILIDGAVGNVTVNNADLNGTRGIEILGDAANNATGTFTFNNVTIDTAAGVANHAFIVDGDQGTATNNDVSATITLNNVDITNPGGLVARIVGISGGTIAFDSASAINRNNGGLGILVESNAGGAINFGGSNKMLITSLNNAVTLSNNSGATINFTSGGLVITTTTGIGFGATGGGTVTVQGNGNTISSGTGTALNMANTTIGAADLTFLSISSNGATKGISLNTTGTLGGLHITGSGTTNGSGGTIQNISIRGIELINTADVMLSNIALTNANLANGTSLDLDISNANGAIYMSGVTTVALANIDISGTTADNGITGINVSDFTMDNSTITLAGNAVDESGIEFSNLSGTSSITNTEISFSETNSLDIVNTDVNLNLTLNNVTFRDTQTVFSGGADNSNGEGGFQFRSFSSAAGTPTTNIDILDSDFLRLRTQAIQVMGEDDSVVSVDITNNVIDAIAGVVGTPLSTDTTHIGSGIDINANDTSNVSFNINSNPTIITRGGSAVNITAFAGGDIQGRINGNSNITVHAGVGAVGPNGNAGGSGVRVVPQETGSTAVVEVRNNNITMGPLNNSTPIDLQARFNNARLDITLDNNNINSESSAVADINITSGSSTAGESNQVYANIINNDISSGGPTNILRLRVSDLSNTNRLFLTGFVEGGPGLDDDAAATWNANGNTPAASAANVNVSLTGTAVAPLSGVATEPSNPLPLYFAPGGTPASVGNAPLTQASLNTLADAAITLWTASGLTVEQASLLQSVNFGIAELPTGYLGEALPGLVLLSSDAAGNTWFIDTSPLDNSEFTGDGLSLIATSTGGAAGQVDALTVIMHELGHVLGFPDGYGSGIGGPLMEGHLGTGQRFLPQSGSALSLPNTGVEQTGPLPLYFQTSPAASSTTTLKMPAQESHYVPRVNIRAFKKQSASSAGHPVPSERYEILPAGTLWENGLLIIPSFELSPFDIMEPRGGENPLPPLIHLQGASAFLQWSPLESKEP